MGTLTSLMNLSRDALMADQEALNITANNVANQNTPGYTRQVANWQSVDLVTINGVSYGGGVSVSAVSQRDRILEQRVQQQTQVQARSGALQAALQQLDSIFSLSASGASAGSTALGSVLDSFFNSLSTLEGNPSDASTRQGVLMAAGNLASVFNSSASQLVQLASQLNQQVGEIAGQVNSLTATIASLNQQISISGAHGDAGALEDQRQSAIRQLSQYVGLNQITTEGDGIALTTVNGAVLVSGSQSFPVTATAFGPSTHIFAGVPPLDVGSSLIGGQLGGLIEARDRRVPNCTTALNNLAYAIGTAINAQNALGLDQSGNPGQPIFSLPATASGAAASIQVVATGPAAIAAATTGEGSAGNSNAIALADIASQNILGGQTAGGFLATFLGQVGNEAAGAATDNAAQQATLTQLTSQRNALSGVSLSEEASNLTQYQRSYEAAAKVFAIVNSIMASALNLGVQTTVS